MEQNNLSALLNPLEWSVTNLIVIFQLLKQCSRNEGHNQRKLCYLVFVQILYTTSIENGYGRKREFKFSSQGFKG